MLFTSFCQPLLLVIYRDVWDNVSSPLFPVRFDRVGRIGSQSEMIFLSLLQTVQ